MNHDTAIPQDLHTGARAYVKDALGAFWSTVFKDQDLIDAELSGRVLSASQLYIDVMEALSLRDHRGSPTFHREHWHPMVIRLSQRNTGHGVTFQMLDTPVIGPQPPGSVYLEGSVFTVGGNATYSKVNTYPFEAMSGCPLVNVRTCICDAIGAPSHVLVQNRDFAIGNGVLSVRKEQDPFDVGGYRIVEDGDDRIAVLWVCDGEFDTNNVGDFLGYPLGIDVASTPAASRMVSAIWDVLIYGVTPQRMNIALGAVFDVPTVPEDTVVESVDTDGSGYLTITTSDATYRIPDSRKPDTIKAGAPLPAGTFLTTDLSVYHSLSSAEFSSLVERHEIGSLSLQPGSVYGVDTTVVIEDIESEKEDGGWFKLNSGDTGSSDFWTAVRSRVSADDLSALFDRLAVGGSTVNPLRALGYTVLANTVLVRTSKGVSDDPCASIVFSMLSRLMPSYASMVVVQEIPVSDAMNLGSATSTVSYQIQVDSKDIKGGQPFSDTSIAASDDVTFTFLPDAATEV